MAALAKGVVSDHHYGGPIAVEVGRELKEAGTWFIAWYCCPKPVTHSLCVQQNFKRECIKQQEI